jgi:hypothetical protein
MSRIDHLRARMILLAATLTVGLVGAPVMAQAPGGGLAAPAARRPVPAQEQDEDQENVDPFAQQRIQQQKQIAEAYLQYFDRGVFQTNGSSNEATTRGELEAVVARSIDRIDRACGGLDDSQRRKLQAAGKGDIKRFFDRVADERSRIAAVDNPRVLMQEIRKAMQSLSQERMALLAGDGPIFKKAVPRTLTPEQVARREKDIEDRRIFRHRAAVRWTVVMLARSLGLTDDQRTRLEKLLLEETRPPRNFASFDYSIVMCQTSHIPEARIRPIFDDVQWRVMKMELATARSQEPWLRRGGYLPEEMLGDTKGEPQPGATIPRRRATIIRLDTNIGQNH